MQSLRELYKIGRGPSSSHTMGPERAAKDFLGRCGDAASYRAILYGSLALTGKGHLTDRAIIDVFEGQGKSIEVIFDKKNPRALEHPNTMELAGYDAEGRELRRVTYLSVGGGSVRAAGEPMIEAEEVYPFRTFSEIMEYCKTKNISLGQVVFDFEGETVKDFLMNVWSTMKQTIYKGLTATGKLPGTLKVDRKAKILFETKPEDEEPEEREKRHLCAFAFATSEENAGGGTVVTAPTCGASGVLPAVLFYLSRKHGFSDNKIVSALAAAGMVGVTVKQNASVSGAEAGCQAEIGTATSMAAAAVCSLFDASVDQTEYAAEIALEHQLGLTCDPICGYVQIPCIERNAVAAMRALESAELSRVLSGTRKISFDLIVHTMYETGKDINARYRETSEGGLAASYKVS